MSDENLKGMQDSDDFEGHSFKGMNDENENLKGMQDDDVEGHAYKGMNDENENLKGMQDDDDVEGHVLKS